MILTIASHVFSLKLLCKKDTYNVYHRANIVKKIKKKKSCWALYYKCVEPSVTFNLLLFFNVYPLNSTSNKQLLLELFTPSALPYT